jgi:sRNA-binding protein
MTTDDKSEKKRGFEEASRKFELLRATWPKAFPARPHEVRPLTNGAQQAMVEALGWSPAYAHAVPTVGKLRSAYCKAILCEPMRINLDGSPSGEEIDDRSRALAKQRLEESAARQAKKGGQSGTTEIERRGRSKRPTASAGTRAGGHP